jgi:hypothetical protein
MFFALSPLRAGRHSKTHRSERAQGSNRAERLDGFL